MIYSCGRKLYSMNPIRGNTSKRDNHCRNVEENFFCYLVDIKTNFSHDFTCKQFKGIHLILTTKLFQSILKRITKFSVLRIKKPDNINYQVDF